MSESQPNVKRRRQTAKYTWKPETIRALREAYAADAARDGR